MLHRSEEEKMVAISATRSNLANLSLDEIYIDW